MTKLRIVGGIPEIDGNPQEIFEILQKPEFVEILQKFGSAQELVSTKQPAKDTETLILKSDVPSAEKIVEMVEAQGRPFALSMGEIGVKYLHKFITSNEDVEIYNSLRNEFDSAKRRLVKKYGGTWDRVGIKVEGHQNMRYILKEDEKPVEQTKSPVEQQKTLPQEEEVEIIKM